MLGVYCQYAKLGGDGFKSGKAKHTQRYLAEVILEEQRKKAAELREHREKEAQAMAAAKEDSAADEPEKPSDSGEAPPPADAS